MVMLSYFGPNNNALQECFPELHYSLEGHDQKEFTKPHNGATCADATNQMVLNNPQLDKLSFADFGPSWALNCEEEAVTDPIYFLKFPVLNVQGNCRSIVAPHPLGGNQERYKGLVEECDQEARVEENTVQVKSKRKRPRSTKTSEQVESQRMTHIAVERNRRKQMNEHLSILRSLMPNSYVQRGDQASIIGGAIEFVRELEQLVQCLETQKKPRIYDNDTRPIGDPPSTMAIPNDQVKLVTAEVKSCLADVEVKILGFDAFIKISSRRKPGQLIKTIAALEDLQLRILHTNITTTEQTILCSFNVKISGESAENIASSIQQMLTCIHANSSM